MLDEDEPVEADAEDELEEPASELPLLSEVLEEELDDDPEDEEPESLRASLR